MKNILFLTIVFCTLGCRDAVLQQSIFISDPNFPDLPAYTEAGYNTFGAYYDLQPFTSIRSTVPFKAISTQNKTQFVFAGQLGAFNYYGGSVAPFSITLTISNLAPVAFSDLISLNNVTMNLKDSKYSLSITDGTTTSVPQILNGTFTINRARNINVDNQLQEVTLSGVFSFQIIINQIPVTVSNGRFDVSVGSDNFFSY